MSDKIAATDTAAPPAERPIVLSAAEVRAVLALAPGEAAELRRPVDFRRAKCALDCSGPKPELAWVDPGGTIFGTGPYIKVPCDDGAAQRAYCPWGYPYDPAYPDEDEVLWARETWAEHPDSPQEWTIYRATDPGWDDAQTGLRWKSSTCMPRWACRLFLRVASVRVERDGVNVDSRARGKIVEGSTNWEWLIGVVRTERPGR